MSYIDIHTHKFDPEFKDSIQVLVKDFTKKEPDKSKYESIGIHPWSIANNSHPETLESFANYISISKPWMLGEMGLDKAIETDFELQKVFFRAQLKIAKKYKIQRIVIHSVRSYSEILECLKKENIKAHILLHDFNSTIEMAKQFMKSFSTYFSFGKKLFEPQTKAFKSYNSLPLERIFLETDIAQITIEEVYKQASQLKDIEKSQLCSQIEQNFLNIDTNIA